MSAIKKLTWALALILTVIIAELIGSAITRSTTLYSDALHMMTDFVSVTIGLFTILFARQVRSPHATFGHHKAKTLSGFTNGILLGTMGLMTFIELAQKIGLGEKTEPSLIPVAIGFGSLALNGTIMKLVHGKDSNHRSMSIHVITDLACSGVVVVSGCLIFFTKWSWLDNYASIAIGIIMLIGAYQTVRPLLPELLDMAPNDFPLAALEGTLHEIIGVYDVHDLHVTRTGHVVSVTVHIVRKKDTEAVPLRKEIDAVLQRFGATEHNTVQIEDSGPSLCSTQCAFEATETAHAH